MRYRFFVLVAVSVIWFVFGTMMIMQGTKEFSDLRKVTGQVERIWTDISRNLKGRPSDILLFKIQGLEQTIGIYHNTKADYDFYLEKIHPGDKVIIYFDEQGIRTLEGYNLHVYQLEKDGDVLLDKEKLNRTDRKVGLILYGVGSIFSIAPIWFYRKKMRA
jgi:hypothetical protein